MTYACTHIDISTQARCCALIKGELHHDKSGDWCASDEQSNQFQHCAGDDSKCVLVQDKRQAKPAASSASSAAASGASHAASAASSAASHAASATHAAGGQISHAPSGSHSALTGAKSEPAKKKKNAGARTGPSAAAALVLAVAVAALLA